MTEELKQGDATETEAPEEKATGTDQTKTEKTFSQEEVNKIVAKEKASWKKSADHEKDGWTETEKSLKASIKEREDVIQEAVDLLKKDLNLDEDLQELFDGMDTLAQYKWLMKKVEKTGKQQIPRTPRSNVGADQSAQPFTRTNTV